MLKLKRKNKTVAKLYCSDCLVTLKKLKSNSIDSIVTDPPYGLGFMGKEWDIGVPAVDVFVEALRVLKPGGHLLAFGGSRTYHRLACAIEDAGFEIRDQIMWVYGSGFPKSHNVSKSIDTRRAGNDVIRPWLESLGNREELACAAEVTPRQIDHYLGQNKTPCPQTLPFNRFERLCRYFDVIPEWAEQMYPKKGEKIREIRHSRSGGNDFAKIPGSQSVSKVVDEHAFATDEAKQWEGWGTALKPAHEPIVLARKPLAGTVAENVLKHGTGGLNIDGCRIGHSGGTHKHDAPKNESKGIYGDGLNGGGGKGREINAGRFPANLIHDGSDEVVGLFPVTGKSTGGRTIKRSGGGNVGSGKLSEKSYTNDDPGFGDSGSAARYFYCAKASKKDRDEGVTLEPKQQDASRKEGNPGGDNPRNRGLQPRLNHHPTVKPTNLMRYLCKLITPPNGIILDPFMGSGTTGKACVIENFRFIGIEKIEEYYSIAKQRIQNEIKNKKLNLL